MAISTPCTRPLPVKGKERRREGRGQRAEGREGMGTEMGGDEMEGFGGRERK